MKSNMRFLLLKAEIRAIFSQPTSFWRMHLHLLILSPSGQRIALFQKREQRLVERSEYNKTWLLFGEARERSKLIRAIVQWNMVHTFCEIEIFYEAEIKFFPLISSLLFDNWQSMFEIKCYVFFNYLRYYQLLNTHSFGCIIIADMLLKDILNFQTKKSSEDLDF